MAEEYYDEPADGIDEDLDADLIDADDYDFSVTIDCTTITSKDELWDAIQEALEPDEGFGRNLDALHDLLTCINQPTLLAFAGFDVLQEALGSYAEKLVTMLADASLQAPVTIALIDQADWEADAETD